MPRPFEIEVSFQVRFYDADSVGYVHNAVYFRWLEDLRTGLLAPHYSLERFVREGIAPVLTRAAIEYRSPLRLFDTFTGRAWVSKLDGLRWTVSHELVHAGKIAATAEQSGIFLNLSTHRPVPAPRELVEKFNAYQEQGSK